MASVINILSSGAKKEATELAERLGISLEEAAQKIYQKYYPSSTVEKVSPSLSETVRGKGFTMEEPSIPTERALVPIDKSRYTEPSRQTEPAISKEQPLALPPGRKFPGKSDTSASEDFESSLGELDTGIYPETKIPTSAKLAAGTVAAGGLAEAVRRATTRNETSAAVDTDTGEKFVTSLQDKSTPEVKKEVKRAVAATDTTAKEVQKAADRGEIPQTVADDYKAQRDEAYKRFDEARDRNDWLQVAQILAQAATQYGAAQVGMRTGRNMAGIQLPGVDYEARTGQEQRLLESRLRDIGEAETRQQRLTERQQERADTAEYRKAELALKRKELEDRAAERAGKMSAEERLEKTTLRDSLNKQLATAQKQYQAALTFANQAAMEDDLSSKTLKKIEEKTPGLLGQADIDPTELQQIEQEATKKGLIWDSIDPQKKQALIKERILDKHRNLLDSIKSQIDKLSGRSAGQSAAASATMPAESRTVTVIHKATGQSRQYPAGSPEVLRAQQDPDFEVK